MNEKSENQEVAADPKKLTPDNVMSLGLATMEDIGMEVRRRFPVGGFVIVVEPGAGIRISSWGTLVTMLGLSEYLRQYVDKNFASQEEE